MFMQFWRRHKKKVYVTLGVLGSGFLLYKLYDGHRRRISELEKELEADMKNDELIKAQMKEHFENIQIIADSTTLPHVMQYLSSRIAEELDLMQLTEKLMKGKDQPNTLTAAEKLELWDRLKILSFTKMVLSLWSMTTLNLYIRVQVNILGRHLYIDTARGLGSSYQEEEADIIYRDDQQLFLASADYLANYGLTTLISDFEAATSEVLKGLASPSLHLLFLHLAYLVISANSMLDSCFFIQKSSENSGMRFFCHTSYIVELKEVGSDYDWMIVKYKVFYGPIKFKAIFCSHGFPN